jgi:hypothetical protein
VQVLAAALILAFVGVCPCRAADLALVHAKIYPSPTDPPFEDESIVIHDGRILVVGSRADVKVPRGLRSSTAQASSSPQASGIATCISLRPA